MDDTNENLEVPDKQAQSSLGMEVKLPRSDYASSIHSEVSDEARELDALLNEGEMKLINSGTADGQESVEESMETMLEALQKVESLIGMDIETSNIDSSLLPAGNEEQLDEAMYEEETAEAMISPIEMEIGLPESTDVPLIQSETDYLKEQSRDNNQAELPRELVASFNSEEGTDPLTKMEIKVPSNEEELDTLTDLREESKEIIKTDVMLELSPEVSKNDKSPVDMYVELTESEVETSLVFDENVENFEEKLEDPEVSKTSEPSIEMEVELPKYDEESIVQSEIDLDKSLEIPLQMKTEVTKIEETLAGLEEPVEEPMDTSQEEILSTTETLIVPVEKPEESEEINSVLQLSERLESPVELNIKVSESEDILTAQLEEQEVVKEQEDNVEPEEKLDLTCDDQKGSNSPSESLKAKDESTVSLNFQEETKEADEEDKPESSESPKKTESPVTMEAELLEKREEDSILSMEKSEDSQEELGIFEGPIQTGPLLEIRIGLTKTDTSATRPEIPDEPDCAKQKENVELSQDAGKSSEIAVGSRDTPTNEQGSVDESVETMLEALQKVESLIDMDLETSNIDDGSILSVEMSEHSEEVMYTAPREPMISPMEMDIEMSENNAASSTQPEKQDVLKEYSRDTEQSELQEELEVSCDSQERIDSPKKMEIKMSDNDGDSVTLKDTKESKKVKADVTLELSSEMSKDSKSPGDMYVELMESEVETSLVFDETVEDFEEKLEVSKESKQPELPTETKVESPKCEDESIAQPAELEKAKEENSQETVAENSNADKSLETPSEMEVEMTESEEPAVDVQEPVEEPMETNEEEISKTPETLIVCTEKQEEPKETNSVQESSEKIESPVEVKMNVPEDEDVLMTQPENQVIAEEQKDNAESQPEKTPCDSPKRTDSPSESLKPEEESVVPQDSQKETKEVEEVEDKPEVPERIESPVQMEVELAEKKEEDSVTPIEKPEESQENQEDFDTLQQTDSLIETEVELPKVDDALVVQPEVQDEPKSKEQEENVDLTEDPQKSSEVSEMETSSEKTVADMQQQMEESMETMFETLQKVGSLIDVDMEASSIDNSSTQPTEKQEQVEDSMDTQKAPDVVVSSLEVETELSETDNAAVIPQEVQAVTEEPSKLQKQLEAAYNSPKKADSPAKMEVEASNNEEDSAASMVLPEESKEVTETEDKLEVLPESSESAKSEVQVTLMETEVETSEMPDEDSQDLEKLEITEDAEESESPKQMEIELSKCEEEKLDDQKPTDAISDADKLPETSSETKEEVADQEETSAVMQESMETTEESSSNTELPINIKIKLSEVGKAPVTSEKEQEPNETKSIPESPKRIESPIEPKVKVSRGKDISITQPEEQIQSKEKLAASSDASKRTNSPLGMKIKLSKSGDASIIPMDFHEEPKEAGRMKEKLESSCESPKRTESPIGMKIKLAKTKGGASIIPLEKSEDPKENLEVPEVSKRTDSPLGMRIKLSKTGDASIIQSEIQDENKHMKHKVDPSQDVAKTSETSFGMKIRLINSEEFREEQMEELQEVHPKVESPLGMKIRLSKHGDASIVPSEKQEHLEDVKLTQESVKRTESPFEMKIKEGQSVSEEHIRDSMHVEPKERLDASYGSPKRTNSPIGMKIKLFKSGDASIVPSSLAEESKDAGKMKDRLVTSSETPKRTESPIGMKIKLAKTKGGASIIPMDSLEDPKENLEVPDVSKRTESPLGMKIKLFKSGDASIVHSEGKDSGHETLSGMKMKVIKAETSSVSQESLEESVEAVPESWQKVESPIGMKIKLSKFGDVSIVPAEKQEHPEEAKPVQEAPKRTESPLGMKIRLSKTGDASIIQPEWTDHPEEHKEHVQSRPKEKLDASYDSPKRTGSPLGMKIKLSKTGDASIVSSDLPEESKATSKLKEKLESSPEVPKRTDSPIGMKIKLTKTKSGAAIISMENPEDSKEKLEVPDVPKRTESPLGMKIKLFKSGDASIVHSEIAEEAKDIKQKDKMENREKVEATQDGGKSVETLSGMKIKMIKSGETPILVQESTDEPVETTSESWQKVESPLGMKIKISKFGDASIIPVEKEEQPEEVKHVQEAPRRTESPLGMKIKLSKSGDASIVQSESVEEGNKLMRTVEAEHSKPVDTTLGMKIKLLKTGDASIVDSEKKRRQDTESPLEMKIKLSKTGHPTIVACDNQGEAAYKQKEASDSSFAQRYKESGQSVHKEPALKILKSGHSTILQSNRSELTIEPVQMQTKKLDGMLDISPKRKDISISPIEAKKPKLEAQLTQILPEVTIQPVASRDQKQFRFDPKTSAISLQQMNVISQEISITQVRPSKSADSSLNEKLKDILSKNVSGSPMNSDCEIIEHRPELIIVNENSNSSQDVVIIEEVSPSRMPEVKVPKKRGRPRRNPLPQGVIHQPQQLLVPRDPLSLDDMHQMQQTQVPHFESRENERPKRTCRNQKSYAPPKRGRGRGRGKRKLDNVDPQMSKKSRIDQDLSKIEASTTAVITIDDSVQQQESFGKSPELYKALKQPTLDAKVAGSHKVDKRSMAKNDAMKAAHMINHPLSISSSEMNKDSKMLLKPLEIMPEAMSNDSKDNLKNRKLSEMMSEKAQKSGHKAGVEDKADKATDGKDMLIPPGHPNWLTPMSKRASENASKHENMSTVQVMDEETRMSAESGSRSQTPARNIPAQASETIINEESQGSVLSTATTESEKVKVKNRRMEINFDPDEGPFTVDKIAEYEWPLDRKGETFMIQEQISQYLGVKSFKRKYPDLKRRVVDMEERNYLRENGLVSEAMCDMGLTAICSSEVLDVMCSDFPDQYEEYRKHMREKQVKEHSKKQKELTAAANAEKNRIDLAEMAVQSALSWNISLNKARREDRKCSLDLQTFTIHVPKKQQKVEERKVGYYPVALIPGQYTDYYREYTPAELRYYPLNTVLYGPTRPNERKFDSQSEGSQSDNDSDSSSDDSSSSSSEGTQNTEGSQSTMDEVDMEIANQKEEIKLKCKMCLKTLNKHSKNEVLIQCGTCNGHVHPSCIDLTLDMVPHIQSYAWQCTDCKTCAQCHDPADEDKMLFCDMCDRGYHIYCVGLRRVPQGRWHCQECAVCANCASREPGGINSDRNSVAQWQHEYKKGDKNTRVYVSTLCVPCSKLWRKGRYCPHCSRCHTAPRLDLEANLVHCSACDKYLHLDCVETKGVALDRKNYLCDFCAPTRQHMMKPLISKTLRT